MATIPMATIPIETLTLAPHVRAAVNADCLLLLDLRHNRYWAQPLATPSSGDGEAGVPATALTRLAALGLVVTAAHKNARVIARDKVLAPPAQAIVSSPACVRGPQAAAVLGACGRAAFDLRRARLDLLLASFARRKRHRATAAMDATRALDRDLAAFRAWRPWFPARRACLFDSIALMHFLLACGHCPTFVIGVRARPFAAHCWLSCGRVVLNDTLDGCAGFSPIAWA